MYLSALDYLCCPETKGSLELIEPVFGTSKDEIIRGKLYSSKTGISYPIVDGIPIFLDDFGAMETTQKAFGNQWKLHSKGFFEKDKIFGRDDQTYKRHFHEYFGIKPGDRLKNKVFLDAGCGLAPYAKFFAKSFPNSVAFGIDMSESIMHVSQDKLRNLHLVRCDLRCPPFREGFADIGWSYGVLHHTPDTKDAFMKLQKYIGNLGKFYIWVYSIHRTKPSFIARKLFFKSYRYPAFLNYVLSYVLAVAPFFVYRLHYLYKSLNRDVRPLLKKHGYINLATGIHDSLVPEFQHYQSKDEVCKWFDEANFDKIEVVGDIGVVGSRTRSTS